MAEEFSDTELSDSPEAEQEQKDQADSQDHAEDGDAGEEEQEGTKDPSKEPAKKGFFGKKKEKKRRRLTGDIADTVGDSEKAEELIAYLKQEVIGHNFESDTEIREVIEDSCDQFQVKLSESEIQELINLLKKIGDLDLDLDSIKKQAESLYKKLSELDIDTGGFFEKVKGFFQAIVDFFKGLFS